MNYTKYIIHLYNRAKKRKYMFSPTIWYCPSDKFVSASIASMAKISVSMQTKHLHTVWMTHFDINLTVAAVYIICVRVWASASWFVLWLNTTLYVLSSILRIKLVLVCSCVCVYPCDQLQYCMYFGYQEIWCFCSNHSDSNILHQAIDCTFKSGYWVLSNIDLLRFKLNQLVYGSIWFSSNYFPICDVQSESI